MKQETNVNYKTRFNDRAELGQVVMKNELGEIVRVEDFANEASANEGKAFREAGNTAFTNNGMAV